MHGKGRKFYYAGKIYEGYFSFGEFCSGRIIKKDGTVIFAEVKKDRLNGMGIIFQQKEGGQFYYSEYHYEDGKVLNRKEGIALKAQVNSYHFTQDVK